MAGSLGGKTTVGRMRHRVRLESYTQTTDDYQGRIKTWSTAVASICCRVETVIPGRTDEQQFADVQQANVMHRVTMRFRTGVVAKQRFVWLGDGQNLVLNIVSVNPMVGDENWLEVWCKREDQGA